MIDVLVHHLQIHDEHATLLLEQPTDPDTDVREKAMVGEMGGERRPLAEESVMAVEERHALVDPVGRSSLLQRMMVEVNAWEAMVGVRPHSRAQSAVPV